MHEVSDFQVEILVNHKRSILCVRPSIKILLLSFYLFKNIDLLVASFRILVRSFQIFFTWVIGGRVRLRCTLDNFQCRDGLLFFDNCRAHCACSRCWWGCSIISLFPYRLKYCLKGPLKAKQQHTLNFGYSLTELKLPV